MLKLPYAVSLSRLIESWRRDLVNNFHFEEDAVYVILHLLQLRLIFYTGESETAMQILKDAGTTFSTPIHLSLPLHRQHAAQLVAHTSTSLRGVQGDCVTLPQRPRRG